MKIKCSRYSNNYRLHISRSVEEKLGNFDVVTWVKVNDKITIEFKYLGKGAKTFTKNTEQGIIANRKVGYTGYEPTSLHTVIGVPIGIVRELGIGDKVLLELTPECDNIYSVGVCDEQTEKPST